MHTNEWNTMDAVVLAAGEGTRLRPLTDDKPKGMVEVDDQPILTHCFDQLVELGADELILLSAISRNELSINMAMSTRACRLLTHTSANREDLPTHCSPSRSTSTTISC